jgi:hypothetical protein
MQSSAGSDVCTPWRSDDISFTLGLLRLVKNHLEEKMRDEQQHLEDGQRAELAILADSLYTMAALKSKRHLGH